MPASRAAVKLWRTLRSEMFGDRGSTGEPFHGAVGGVAGHHLLPAPTNVGP
jgi:hypothetical protein